MSIRPTAPNPVGEIRRAASAVLLAALGLVFAMPSSGADSPVLDETTELCLACHADPDLTLTLDDGSELSLHVDPADLAASVHGTDLVCTDCHGGYDSGDHPSGRTFADRRAVSLASYELCKSCHFDTYTRTLESVHFTQLEQGNRQAPVCADCHGAHRILDPRERKEAVSQGCATCHERVAAVYAGSVHGKALLEAGNDDVPACADCHTAHSIADPGTVRFRMQSPEICIGCHGNEEKMEPYGIPTDVATSYLADFHGVTASLSRDTEVDERHLVVTCGDCHGVHDVEAMAAIPPAVMKERVARVCADCHQDAAQDFPAAWLSHYRPSLGNAPLVYLIELLYKIFIPFMILGLGLQVLLHLYRVAIRR